MSAVVYADFSCPACYLASLRVDRLIAAGHPVPEWRAVEHRPRLPLTGLRLDPSAQIVRSQELDEVRLLADPDRERLPDRAPALLPHGGSPVAAYAEACVAEASDRVRRLLFHAYWVEGKDIGDPEVLRRLLPPAFGRVTRTGDPVRDFGCLVTSQHGPITTAAYRLTRQWQRDWLALGAGVDLTLATDDGVLTGAGVLAELGIPLVAPRICAVTDIAS